MERAGRGYMTYWGFDPVFLIRRSRRRPYRSREGFCLMDIPRGSKLRWRWDPSSESPSPWAPDGGFGWPPKISRPGDRLYPYLRLSERSRPQTNPSREFLDVRRCY